jgi:hypothetical protein
MPLVWGLTVFKGKSYHKSSKAEVLPQATPRNRAYDVKCIKGESKVRQSVVGMWWPRTGERVGTNELGALAGAEKKKLWVK